MLVGFGCTDDGTTDGTGATQDAGADVPATDATDVGADAPTTMDATDGSPADTAPGADGTDARVAETGSDSPVDRRQVDAIDVTLDAFDAADGGDSVEDRGADDRATDDREATDMDVVDAATTPVPDCVRNLLAACPLEGACQGWVNDAGAPGAPVQKLCYASGVRVTVTEVPSTSSCPGTPKQTVEVRKADGTLCYSRTHEIISFCEGEQYLWRDAAGNVVAIGDIGSPGGLGPKAYSITCTASSESVSCQPPNPASGPCLSFPPALEGCSAGDCP